MNEFQNRIDAQRFILKIINKHIIQKEQLYSLSKNAIERWLLKNNITNEKIISLLIEASENLFFLANKSQEQISDNYKILSNKVLAITKNIEIEAQLYNHSHPNLSV